MGTYLSTPVLDKHTENGTDFDDPTTPVSWAVVDMQGWRKSMEDAHIARTDVTPPSCWNNGASGREDNESARTGDCDTREIRGATPTSSHAKVFAVFDGHGGPEVARFCQTHLVRVLTSQPSWQGLETSKPAEKLSGTNGNFKPSGLDAVLSHSSSGASQEEASVASEDGQDTGFFLAQALVDSFHALDKLIDDPSQRQEIEKWRTQRPSPYIPPSTPASPVSSSAASSHNCNSHPTSHSYDVEDGDSHGFHSSQEPEARPLDDVKTSSDSDSGVCLNEEEATTSVVEPVSNLSERSEQHNSVAEYANAKDSCLEDNVGMVHLPQTCGYHGEETDGTETKTEEVHLLGNVDENVVHGLEMEDVEIGGENPKEESEIEDEEATGNKSIDGMSPSRLSVDSDFSDSLQVLSDGASTAVVVPENTVLGEGDASSPPVAATLPIAEPQPTVGLNDQDENEIFEDSLCEEDDNLCGVGDGIIHDDSDDEEEHIHRVDSDDDGEVESNGEGGTVVLSANDAYTLFQKLLNMNGGASPNESNEDGEGGVKITGVSDVDGPSPEGPEEPIESNTQTKEFSTPIPTQEQLLNPPTGIVAPSVSVPTRIQNGRKVCNLPDHPVHAGCTSVVAVIMGRTLVVANAGDSRAVICRAGGVVEPLSFDHKPLQKREMNRITKAGGFVNQFGRVNGNLNLSRSIGDLKYKQVPGIPPPEQMITAEPDIIRTELRQGDEFIVLGCDGIWDCLSNEDCVKFIRDRIECQRPREIGIDMLNEIVSADPRASQGIGGDNMTIMIVDLLPHTRSYHESSGS